MHLPSQWQVNRVHEKNIFFWRLSAVWLSDSAVGFSSHRHLLSWLYCLIQLLFPFVLCGGVRQPSFPWKITFFLLMVMLSQNLSPWVFLSPDSKALSVLFRGGALEMTEMVVSLLPRCDWCRLPPLARHIRVLGVWCVWLLSARVTLALKVPFYLVGGDTVTPGASAEGHLLLYQCGPGKFFS